MVPALQGVWQRFRCIILICFSRAAKTFASKGAFCSKGKTSNPATFLAMPESAEVMHVLLLKNIFVGGSIDRKYNAEKLEVIQEEKEH